MKYQYNKMKPAKPASIYIQAGSILEEIFVKLKGINFLTLKILDMILKF
jgi:hypothetical protein